MKKGICSVSFSDRRRERGAVLVVGLVMVLLISIIGLSAIRGSNLQEAIAGNMRERNLAFQAAESALRLGEGAIADTKKRPLINNKNGLYNDTYKTPVSSILTFASADWISAEKVTIAALDLAYVKRPPSYVVEQLDPDLGAGAAMEGSGIDTDAMLITGDITPYRVTSRGFGAGENSVKTLQTSYNRRYFQ